MSKIDKLNVEISLQEQIEELEKIKKLLAEIQVLKEKVFGE